MRVLDHPEERILLALSVNDELRAENLVAAVLGVHLTEHHKLRIGGIALRRLEGICEILHLRLGDGKTELYIRFADRLDAAAKHVKLAAGLGRQNVKEVVKVKIHAFGHAVKERRKRGLHLIEAGRERRRAGTAHRESDCAFDTLDALHAAVLEDIRGFGGPWGDGTLAWRDVERRLAPGRPLRRTTATGLSVRNAQQSGGTFKALRRNAVFVLGLDRIHPTGAQIGLLHARDKLAHGGLQSIKTERRERIRSQKQNRFHLHSTFCCENVRILYHNKTLIRQTVAFLFHHVWEIRFFFRSAVSTPIDFLVFQEPIGSS